MKYLREKGLSNASKKAERSTNEGKIFITTETNTAVILELNCETDFVAKNDDFTTLGNEINRKILTQKIQDNDINAISKEEISDYILKLGENITIKQFQTVHSDGAISSYVHSNQKIGVIVTFSNTIDPELGRNIAMHIAATNPTYIKPEDVKESDIKNEKEIIQKQSKSEGKPENVIEKIMEGRINKFYKEICLNEQAYIKDDKQSIKQILPANTAITSFIRYSLV